MRSIRKWFSHYRPRVLTVAVFVAVAAMIVLANLSFDKGWMQGFGFKSYGWPLIWHRYVSARSTGGVATVARCYSASRLASNVAMWLTFLTALPGACECLLRRYQPRPRWRLRTMLIGMGLAAALCSWFAVLRDRAELQDQVIATVPGRYPHVVKVERWGPKWLDLLGADRYRRDIVAYGYPQMKIRADEDGEKLLRQLAALPKLRKLLFEFDRLTPGMVAALNGMRHLRCLDIQCHFDDGDDHNDSKNRPDAILPPIGNLSQLETLSIEDIAIDSESLAGLANLKTLLISNDPFGDKRTSPECYSAIGQLPQLERLIVWDAKLSGESLACLVGLSNLKSLQLSVVDADEPSLLDRLPMLPRLESLELAHSVVRDHDLHHVARLPRLKSLGLERTNITGAGLAVLAPLESLEELTIGDAVSATALESLRSLKHLKKLHLSQTGGLLLNTRYTTLMLDNGYYRKVPTDEADDFRRAVEALRQARPGIVIDGDANTIHLRLEIEETVGTGYDVELCHDASWLPASDVRWMTPAERAAFKKQSGWFRFDGAGRCQDDGRIVAVSF